MEYTKILKHVGRGNSGARSIDQSTAHALFGALLDGGVPDMELGGLLIAFRLKGEAPEELRGFYSALHERISRLRIPQGEALPVVLPTYNGARHQANLLPLLALLLQRFGIPVLLHGVLDGHGRVATAYVLRELGIMPARTVHQAQTALNEDGLAFVPTAVLSPGLADLMALRARLGVRSSAHSLAKMLQPFHGPCVRVVSVSHPEYLQRMQDFFADSSEPVLLLRGTEGEPFANPKRRPKLEAFGPRTTGVLFEAETGSVRVLPHLPADISAKVTADWIREALAGTQPIPVPIVNQLACLLFLTGYAEDMNQAKAIVAVETGSLAAA